MLKWLPFFICFLFGTVCFAFQEQNEKPSDLELYQSYFNEKSKKTSEEDLTKLQIKLNQAVEVEDLALQAQILKEMGMIHLTQSRDYEKAMDCLIKSLSIEDSLDLKKSQVFSYLAIAKVFEEVGDFSQSANLLEQALELSQKDKEIQVVILNELGRINAAMGRVDDAFDYFERILEYKETITDASAEAEAYFNLALLYTIQEKYDDALNQHKSALAIRRLTDDKKREAESLSEIAEIYKLQKNNEKALDNHIVALEIRKTIQDRKGLAESFNQIGALYYQSKNYQRAIANLQLGLKAAQEVQASDALFKSYDYLSNCHKALGDFKKALEYKDLLFALNEFIQNESNEQQILGIQNRYLINKKENQIQKLESIRIQRENEIAAQNKFRNFLFAIIALSVIIAILIAYLYFQNKRTNKILLAANERVKIQNIQLQELNGTKDKFFSILGHDLKGPLNSLSSFSSLLINHTDSLSKDEIKMLAADLDKSLKNLFALLENLLEWSRSQTGNIEFKPEPLDLLPLLEQNKALLSSQAQNKNISIEIINKNTLIASAHKQSIDTVLRNLISNSIKFTPEGGQIKLGFKQENEEIILSIVDNGVGMTEEVMQKIFRIDTKHSTKGTKDEKGTGLGLILCKDFIEKNGGKIWVKSEIDKGSAFYFSLPALKDKV